MSIMYDCVNIQKWMRMMPESEYFMFLHNILLLFKDIVDINLQYILKKIVANWNNYV